MNPFKYIRKKKGKKKEKEERNLVFKKRVESEHSNQHTMALTCTKCLI